jgi:hypothetical protein
MKLFDAEEQVAKDLKEEGRIIAERETPSFTVTAVRHPTLGKLVIVEDAQGNGVVVETEE